MVYPEGIFLWWGLFIPGFKTIAYVVDKQSYIWRRYLLLQGLCVPSVKTTTYVCNRFNTSFCARDHKTNQAISNLNLKFWNKSTKQIKSTTFWPISVLSKNLSISKLIYVDTYYVLFVIIVTEYDVSSNEIFFLTSQKGGGNAKANYLKVENDVTYWITIVSDWNQNHAAPNFMVLSSYIASLRRSNLLHTTAWGYKGWRKE